MSDPLGQYIARKKAEDEASRQRIGASAAGEVTPESSGLREIPGYIPPSAIPLLRRLGVNQPIRHLGEAPQPVLELLNAVQPAVDKLGPEFDYRRLGILAQQNASKLPPEVTAKMSAMAILGSSRQAFHRIGMLTEAGAAAATEAGRQATFGILPSYEDLNLEYHDLSPRGVAIAKALGAIAGLAASGKLVYSALSRVTLLPKIGPLILQLPQRVREITLGVGTAGVLDAARPDGLPEDPAAIDIPARLAHPLADALGGGEVAERASLFLTGGAFGGVVSETLGPILRGIQLTRETYLLSKVDPKLMEVIRERLTEAGVGVTRAETNRSVIAKALRNMERIGQSEKLAGLTALDETRMDFIMHQLYSDPAFSGPPKLPRTVVVDETGAPMRMYHGSMVAPTGPLQGARAKGYGLFSGEDAPAIYSTSSPELASEYAGIHKGQLRGALEETTQGYGFTHERFFTDAAKRAAYEADHPTFKVVTETPAPLGTKIMYLDPIQPNVQPVYLDIQNPLNAEEPWSGGLKARIHERLLKSSQPDRALLIQDLQRSGTPMEWIKEFPSPRAGAELNLAARDLGYDGILYQGGQITGGPAHQVAVAFHDSQVIPAFVSDDAKLMAGVFRANPGGMSVARGVTNIRAADELVKRMGLNVTAIRVGEDYLLLRPQINYPTRPVGAKLSKQMEDFTTYVRAANRGKPTSSMAILPDGTPVRGEYNPAEMTSRYKLKPPVVNGGEQHELALREHFGMVEVHVETGGVVKVNLSTTITQRQADVLARIADRGVPEMVINSSKPGLTRTLEQPLGMQVQDIMADMVQGADRPKISAATMAKVNQYRSTGVFQGQAAHLSDGYPVEVIRKVTNRAGQSEIVYRDPLTGSLHRVGADNIAILPTSLEGEFAPTNAFMDAMEPAEREAFATLRRGLNEGLAKPIKTITQLESFAATRGKFVTNLGRGRIRVHDANTGEARLYQDFKAAIRGIKESVGPLPDLTPPEIEEVLGFKPNMGSLGNGGPPARFGEPIAITEDEFDRAAYSNTLGQLVPGAIEQFFKPTRGLMLDLERRYGLPFGRVFLNLQDATVHRQNFMSAWVYGEGPGLPEGVKPLHEIYRLAGGKASNQRLVTVWLESESDNVARSAAAAQMTPKEIQAAQELRKWYGVGHDRGLFATLGIESDFLTDYAPHIRANGEQEGNDITELWRRTRGEALPKAVDFFADYSRDGTMNIYEDRAFVAAAQYLNAGARTRFMNSAMDDAKKLLRAVSDNGVKAPLANYIEALRGSEFAPQRAALDASFTRMMRSLGASDKIASDIGEKLSLNLLGLSYSATMAFRPGLAVRNAGQIFQTLWPLLGRFDDSFAEGIGRAISKAGRDEAIAAGAITVKQTAVFAGEEVAAVMPTPLRQMSEAGLKLYDGADSFARAVSFHTAKIQAQRAIEEFGVALKGGKNLAEAQRVLIRRSGAMVLDKPIVDDFMRRLATSPESASDFIGKQITDVTQYLYGRGNQPRWMRSVPGRFFGQFGTWPLWFIDFTKRSFLNMWRNGYQKEALAFIGKLALVDIAIYEAGKAVGLDLRRWMGGNSLFYTGGPAMEVVRGTLDLVRGAGESFLGTYESPATRQRLTGGVQTLERAGLAFVPNMYAVRDIGRLFEARTPTEVLAATLAVRPNTDYTVAQRLDLLLNPGRFSTDIDLEHGGDKTPTAVELMIQGMGISEKDKNKLQLPGMPSQLPSQPQGYEPAPPQRGGFSKVKVTTPATVRPQGRPPLEPSALPPSIRSGESKPIKQ